MSCMKKEVCRDALVQTVSAEHLVCSPALLKVTSVSDIVHAEVATITENSRILNVIVSSYIWSVVARMHNICF